MIKQVIIDVSVGYNLLWIKRCQVYIVRNFICYFFFSELDLNSKQKKFNEHHVYFQGDQKDSYIQLILENMISSPLLKRM